MTDKDEKLAKLKHEIDPLGEMNIDLDPAHFENFTEEDAIKWHYSGKEEKEKKEMSRLAAQLVLNELLRAADEFYKEVDNGNEEEKKELRKSIIVMKLLQLNMQSQDILEKGIEEKQKRVSRKMTKENVQALIKTTKALVEIESEVLQLLEELDTLME